MAKLPCQLSKTDRVVNDAIELAEYVRVKLGKRKLVLVGQSAGTFYWV